MTDQWQHWIDRAFQAGWRVRWSDEVEGFVIVTPAAPRRPALELGCYTHERKAWHGAANLCSLARANTG